MKECCRPRGGVEPATSWSPVGRRIQLSRRDRRQGCECMWLEILLKGSKTFLVGIIYRHPHEGVQWNELFENQFDIKVLECEKEVYLMGDLNRDLLQENI